MPKFKWFPALRWKRFPRGSELQCTRFGAMKALRSKLQQHSTTRRWTSRAGLRLGDRHGSPDLTAEGLEQREDLKWQQHLASTVRQYTDAVTGAFEALARVHDALDVSGFAEETVAGTAPLAESLRRGLLDAHSVVCRTAANTRDALESLHATLVACAEDIIKADTAALEFQRYTQKVETLADDEREAELRLANDESYGVTPRRCLLPPASNKQHDKAHARLDRNRGKLQAAAQAATLAQTRASDSLRACMLRRGELCRLVRVAVDGTAEALRSAASHLGVSHSASPPCTTAPHSARNPLAMHRGVPCVTTPAAAAGSITIGESAIAGPNPFDEDLDGDGDDANADPLGLNPFNDDIQADDAPQCIPAKASDLVAEDSPVGALSTAPAMVEQPQRTLSERPLAESSSPKPEVRTPFKQIAEFSAEPATPAPESNSPFADDL